MSDTPYVAPTLEGRALLDLGRQLAAMRAERDGYAAHNRELLLALADAQASLADAEAERNAMKTLIREARDHVCVSRDMSQQDAYLYRGYPRARRYEAEVEEATALLALIDEALA